MAVDGILRPPVLNISTDGIPMPEIPLLPETTMAAAHANALEWLKIKTATSQDLRKAVSDLERFTGETGELNHFLKGGDRLIARIEAKVSENLLGRDDADSLKAALVCRIKRGILNQIQADEETPWPIVKERLKKGFGGGRWTPEEDIFQMFREVKQSRQSRGQYAGTLLARFNRITEKMRETLRVEEVEARMNFLSLILKVQLAKETGKKESLPRERTFVECAQDMVDESAREEEARMELDETGWNRITYRRPRTTQASWKKKEFGDNGRERAPPGERRPGQARPRNSGRKEERKCHGCGKTGHLVAQCPRTRCFECGTEGHIARQCPYIYRRRETPQAEPMEINAQRVRRRSDSQRQSGSSIDSTETSGNSESEEEVDEPGNRGRQKSGRSSWRRVAGGKKPREEI